MVVKLSTSFYPSGIAEVKVPVGGAVGTAIVILLAVAVGKVPRSPIVVATTG